MALEKAIAHGDDGEVTYWRLVSDSRDYAEGVLRYVIAGYRDEAARRAGRRPLQEVHDEFRPAELGKRVWEITPGDIYAHAKRSQASAVLTGERARAQGYPDALVGQDLVEGVVPPLSEARDV